MMTEKPTHEKINQKKMSPKASSAQWQTTFDAIRDAVCLLDMNGKILRCNKAMESLLKKSSKEIIGGTCWELIHGTDKPIKGCPIVRMKKTLCRETLALKVDDKCLNVTVDPVIDETGNLTSAVHIISDITQRKQAEQSLQTAETELEHTIEVVPGIIAKANAHTGYFTHCNPALSSILGFSSEEFLAQPFIEFIHPDDRQNAINEVEKQLKGSPLAIFENRYICKNGSYKWLEWRATAADEKGVVYAAATDITERKKMEEAISESEEKYRTLVENTNDIIFTVDLKGNFLFVNKAFRKIFGYSDKEIKKISAFKLVHPEDLKTVEKQFAKLIEGKRVDSMEYRYKTKYGSYVNILNNASPISDSQGNVVAAFGIARDITERKQTEEKLRESEQRFRSIFENITNIAVQGYDADRKIIFWNQASEKLYGYKTEEAIGKQLEDLIIPPEMRESVIEAVKNWAENEIPIPHGELELMRKDKTTVPVYSSHVMLKNIRGKFEMYCIDIDMTEHKRAKEKLWESAEKYWTMIENANDLIWVLDTQGKFKVFNRQVKIVSGYKIEDWKGKSFAPLIHQDDLEMVNEVFQKTLLGEQQQYSVRIYQKNGEMRILSVNTAPNYKMGKIDGTVSFGRDITERKKAEVALKRSNEELLKEYNQRKMLSRSLIDLLEKDRRRIAMELHDHIGQTLTSLKMYLEMIHGGLKPGHTELGAQIAAAQERTIQAIKDIKNISRGLRPAMIEALGVVSSLRELFNEIHQQTDIEIRFFSRKIPKRFEEVKELTIYRIAQEALTNIIRHAKAKNVFVNLVKKDEKLLLSVEDNGVGFDRDKVMKPSKRKGSLGLLIMRERAVQLGGEFTIESQPGKGTHLLVEIPI